LVDQNANIDNLLACMDRLEKLIPLKKAGNGVLDIFN